MPQANKTPAQHPAVRRVLKQWRRFIDAAGGLEGSGWALVWAAENQGQPVAVDRVAPYIAPKREGKK